jgi:hypothetical protein
MVHAQDIGSHKVARTLVLALIASLVVFWAAILIATWGIPSGIFGWNLAPNGTRLMYVSPGKPAYQAGLRVGNRIDWSSLSVLGRANLGLVQPVSADKRLTVIFYDGSRIRKATLVPELWPYVTKAQRLSTAAGLFLILIGIALVQMRPSRMTWSFLCASLVTGAPMYMTIWGQDAPWKFLIANGFVAILGGVSSAGILIFMSRFPTNTPRGPLVLLDRIAVPIGAAVATLGIYIDIDTIVSSVPPAREAVFINEYLLEISLIVVALGALIVAYALTKGSDRQRIIPVLVAFTFYVAASMAYLIYRALYTEAIGFAVLSLLQALATLSLAISVANGVIRHRVLDVSFVVSRTLVYTILTSLLVAVFALIDFVSGQLLERLQITLLLEACAALAFGIWLNAIHARIERFVDRVLFRRRHLAEAHLERTGKALLHAESPSFVDEALVIEACDALALSSAAVFRIDGERFARVQSRGWEKADVQNLERGDHLVVNLLSELEPIDMADVRWPRTDIPSGINQPLLAIPLVVRHDMLGFVLYGGHVGGEAIDPDEKKTLARLADAAAAAYEHIESKTLIAQTNELRTQNTLLQHEQLLLREMIERLGGRSQTG